MSNVIIGGMPRPLDVVFLTLYPVETASTRQRIHKNVRFFPSDLRATILPGITAASLRRLEARGGSGWARSLFLAEELGRKLRHLWRARRADVIVVQKGLTVMNLRGLPRLLFALGPPVVFDFDDAVYLEPPQAFRSRLLRWLVEPHQVRELFGRSAAIVAGNRFLAGVAAETSRHVEVIVTPMDTDWYRVTEKPGGPGIVLGWSGSTTTNHYVDLLAPIVARVARALPDLDVELRVFSNDDRGIHWERLGAVRTTFVAWRLATLVEDLLAIDIGLMPLHDDEWSRSKCGGKVLQYMACGIPPVASPVGINAEVIEEGVTGSLAASEDEWVARIVRLARDPALRRRIGAAARRKVEAEHCNRVTSPALQELIRRVTRAATG